MRTVNFLLILLFSLSVSGCLYIDSMFVKGHPKGDGGGTAEIILRHLQSDAATDSIFTADVDTFIRLVSMNEDSLSAAAFKGRRILAREFFEEDGKLNLKVTFAFDILSELELIKFEKGRWQSASFKNPKIITSSNGELIDTDDFKGIVWSPDKTELQYDALASYKPDTLRSLLPYYKQLMQGKN